MPPENAVRLTSIDAYRGLVMLMMMAEALYLCDVAAALPESGFWAFLCYHQSHADWVGCSLHDLIQPSFTFLVGVALPFSLARRIAEGQPLLGRTLHAFWRALLLVLLGVWLRSIGEPQTYWTFEDTLTQIGLGYGFLYLIAHTRLRTQVGILGVLLVGYWLLFALWPQEQAGLAGHWRLNPNPAQAFDRWFLNLFPRATPFTFHEEGYVTLSFIPTLGTMVLGLIAGQWLRADETPGCKLRRFALYGGLLLVAGWALGVTGVCPVVKKIWTPSWVLFSGGWCFLILAAFHAVIDVAAWKRWAFPLVVIGMNSIAAYVLAHLVDGFLREMLHTHLGAGFFNLFGEAYAPLIEGGAVVLLIWSMLWWMHRRKLFLRI